MLSLDFIKLVLLANIIAWPLAYILMRNWLGNFAYRISMTLDILVIAGILAVGIALLTISYKSIKIAIANPAESLRYE
jgi:putative ABC transport system permease protein